MKSKYFLFIALILSVKGERYSDDTDDAEPLFSKTPTSIPSPPSQGVDDLEPLVPKAPKPSLNPSTCLARFYDENGRVLVEISWTGGVLTIGTSVGALLGYVFGRRRRDHQAENGGIQQILVEVSTETDQLDSVTSTVTSSTFDQSAVANNIFPLQFVLNTTSTPHTHSHPIHSTESTQINNHNPQKQKHPRPQQLQLQQPTTSSITSSTTTSKILASEIIETAAPLRNLRSQQQQKQQTPKPTTKPKKK